MSVVAVEASLTSTNYPGQLWSPDDQCKLRYGPNASFCRVCIQRNTAKRMLYFNSFSFSKIFVQFFLVCFQSASSQICSLLYCRTTPDSGECTPMAPAAEGTVCGSGMVIFVVVHIIFVSYVYFYIRQLRMFILHV